MQNPSRLNYFNFYSNHFYFFFLSNDDFLHLFWWSLSSELLFLVALAKFTLKKPGGEPNLTFINLNRVCVEKLINKKPYHWWELLPLGLGFSSMRPDLSGGCKLRRRRFFKGFMTWSGLCTHTKATKALFACRS